jgi:DNA-binding NarL/FixJ family response regulator
MRRSFLIVEHNPEGQFLLSKTLKRKFPEAEVASCQEAGAAIDLLRAAAYDAVVVHRAADMDGAETIRQLLAARPGTLVVMVSGCDRANEALAAGASVFLPYDQWLLLGTVVTEEIAKRTRPAE